MKLWVFRFTVLLLAPVLFLLLLEFTLRIAQFGYPTSFFLKMKVPDRRMLVQNDRFCWRFLGPNYSRTPDTFAIAPKAPSDTVRIFVLGESAAKGDPKPAFGLPRVLDAMLSLRYPSTDFEVVNVAITAINSHVIREIASDSARADGDIWVVYMGNNEVVGPYGSGTVFGPQTPPLSFIRASLALRTLRTGQLIEAIHARLNPPPEGEESWGGMQMFLNQQVPADDPRMTRVYEYFQSNLEDIIDSGIQAGADIAVCNVAVNLRDCAPFGSQHRSGISNQATAEWQRLYQLGISLQEQQDWSSALSAFEDAEAMDAQFAELHFRKGQCALQLGDAETALAAFSQARDLDTLRFRFDSRMDRIVRDVVSRREDPRIRFVDAEAAFAEASPDGIPGWELFYEHVHLTWEGNWLLARTIAEQLDAFLPDHVKKTSDALSAWPTADQCAQRLAWTKRDLLECLGDVQGRLRDPPFTLQLNHAEQIEYLNNTIKSLDSVRGPIGLVESRKVYESAVEVSPDDAVLLGKLAAMRLSMGETDGAIAAARRVTELLPHAPSAWDTLATTLVQSDQLDRAIELYRRGLDLDPTGLWIRHHLAQAYVKAGNPEKALKEWKRLVKYQPKFGTAYLGMGEILESQGRTDAANEQYRKAVENPVNRSADLAGLGRLCLRKGWYQEALQFLQNAALMSPTDAAIRYDLANAFKALGRENEAAAQLALARQYDANTWVARFQAGLELGRQGRPQEAVEEFRAVVRLQPNLKEGHLNLAIALLNLNLRDEAIESFKRVLELDPANPQALQYLEALGVGVNATARP